MFAPVILLLRADRVRHSGLHRTRWCPNHNVPTQPSAPTQAAQCIQTHAEHKSCSLLCGRQPSLDEGSVFSHLPAGAGD